MGSYIQRIHLRSPLNTSVLYVDDEFVLKAKIINISEGGVLLESLPHVPEIAAIPLIIPLVQYPDFQKLGKESILLCDLDNFEYEVVRAKTRIVRSFEGKTDIDKIFVSKVGCQFVVLDKSDQEKIADYVAKYARNIIFLLGLFETSTKRESEVRFLRHVAGLLSYPSNEKIQLLRQYVLHDYQSLESL